MSPRRKVDPADEVVFIPPDAGRGWRKSLSWSHIRSGAWLLPAFTGVAALLIAGAITVSTLILISHEQDRRSAVADAEVLGYVRSFMTEYTTLDPFHANDYADGIFAHATGDFAKVFKERMNEIVIQVARSEPSSGTVLEAGVEKRYENGSVSVLVAAKVTTMTPDGKDLLEDGSRWVATAVKEGQQWKISQLTQVI